MKKITIVKNGPYLVQGDIPLVEKVITPTGNSYDLVTTEDYTVGKTYALCRCGHSKNPPFCDGVHASINFDGNETCEKQLDYFDRAKKIEGATIDIYDDGRCAFARFCHQENGDAWELAIASDNEENRSQAIKAASECTAGRLVVTDKMGNSLNYEYDAEIEILQDPENGVSGPIGVKGNIPLQSSDGTMYPMQHRYALCRCGQSRNKPFCDCSHVPYGYVDKE